jgi:branched-chain amino acid transport system permease protein
VISNFITTVIGLGGIYAILAMGLNLQLGSTGLINFGIVGYVATGAYGYAILTAPAPGPLDYYRFGPGLPMWVGVVGGCAVAAIFAGITSWPCLRLRGDYLALMTFGFAEVLQVVLTNATGLTNGTLGFSSIQPPFADQAGPNYPWVFALMVIVGIVVVFSVLRRIMRSPYGRILLMIRDDELATVMAGRPFNRYRLQSFVLGGAIYGLGGVFFAWYNSNVTPNQFDVLITITVFVAFALGRFRSNIGSVLGAFFIVAITQFALQVATSISPDIGNRMGGAAVALQGAFFVVLLRLDSRGTKVFANLRARRLGSHVETDVVADRELTASTPGASR